MDGWIGWLVTGEIPRVALVDVDLGDDGDGARHGGRLVHEVVHDQLLVRGVEPEPGWEVQVAHSTATAAATRHGRRRCASCCLLLDYTARST